MNVRPGRSTKQSGKAAVEFCEDRRIQFKVITEDELGIK